MSEWFPELSFVNWRDALDVALVTFLLYRLFLWIHGTRVVSALAGVLLLVAVYCASYYFGLYTMIWLLDNLFDSLLLVMVILFHEDIRQWLSSFGLLSFHWNRRSSLSDRIIDDLVWVCGRCARAHIGLLIVIEGRQALGDMMQGGVVLDAQISRELLMTIFFPKTALHDGAVIIRNGRICAAGCILPLAKMAHQHFGTRHRAALGATEVSDAVVLVVSEERGQISLARGGHLAVMDTTKQLKESLIHACQK